MVDTEKVYYKIYQDESKSFWIVEDSLGNKATGESVAEAFEKLEEDKSK